MPCSKSFIQYWILISAVMFGNLVKVLQVKDLEQTAEN